MPPRAFHSIPSPREIPFVGSVHRRFRSPLDFFEELKRNFGDAARFSLFNERFILFSDPALVNEVLVTKQDSFRKGKALEGARVFLGLRLPGAKLSDWKDREHFYSFCARAMRWILTDHARARIREERRIGRLLPFTKDIRWLGEREEDAFDLDRALSRLEEIDPRKAKVIELRVYLGCSAEETAGVLNLSKATV